MEINPSLMQEQEYLPSTYDLHFPDPFLNDDDLFLSHFLSQQQQLFVGDAWEDHQAANNSIVNTNKHISDKITTEGKKKKKNIRKNGSNPKNRTGKKDRHSKICTAQGPRDRRMRLSLQIARKFFDLQDMLGFDKASKTIEWLLSHSYSAIKELKDNLNKTYSYVSSGSSEVLSEIRDTIVCIGKREPKPKGSPTEKEETFMGIPKDKKSRKLRTVPRESRDRARARARERTKEKLLMKGLENSKPISHSDLKIEENSCFHLQENTQFGERPLESVSATRIDHDLLGISDFPDFSWDGKYTSTMQEFGSGNKQLENPNSTLLCPNSMFMSTSVPPHLKPYSF